MEGIHKKVFDLQDSLRSLSIQPPPSSLNSNPDQVLLGKLLTASSQSLELSQKHEDWKIKSISKTLRKMSSNSSLDQKKTKTIFTKADPGR